jgi:fibronectin-binding autotransporter adhesin
VNGVVRIAGGTLALANPLALASATLDMNAADTGSLSYGMSSGTVNIGGLMGSRTFSMPSSGAVAVGWNGQNTTFSGTLAGDSSGRFIKQGAGTLTLSGSSPAFTAKTAIDAGTLAVNGSLANSPVTVNAGGRLAGTGVVGTTTVNAGGTLMPGNSPGTLTVSGGLTFASGGNYNWQIHDAAGTAGASTGWDLVNVGGVLDVSATTESPFNINLWSLSGVGPDSNGAAVNFNPAASGTWTIATAAAGITNFDAGKFAVNVSAAHDAGGFTNALDGGTFRLVQQGNDLNIVFTPKMIPNPSTLTWYGDGVHPGGSGVWTTTGANWFDGTAVRPWVPGARAVFSGSGGTVTLGEAVAANGGLAFTATGYTVAGVGLTLGGTANAVDVAAGASATLAAPLAGTAGLTKAGPGTLSLAAANTIGGAMVVQTGTVVVASPAATAASTVRVQAGGAVKIEPGVTMRAPSLTLDGGRLDAAGATLLVSGTGGIGQFVIASGTVAGAPGLVVSGSGQVSLPTNIRQVVNLSSLAIDQATGGKLDIGKGRINVAPGGIAEADLRADLIAGRGTGSFSGTAGIVTTGGKASETSANPVVGYRVLTSGSAIVAWAAYGDTNLDGLVNSSDIGLIIAGGKFGKGTGAVWVQGDFTYSGNVNSTDISLLSQSGLYGKGSYLPPASLSVTLADDVRPLVTTEFLSGPIGMTIMAAVPEPSTIVLAAAGVCLTVAFRMGRRRSASKQS